MFWLAVWQFGAWQVGRELFLPAPMTVLRRLVELSGTGVFWLTAGLTLGRVLLGLVWGTVLGCVLAALTVSGRWLDAILSPAVRVVRATPDFQN